jgi:twinkle protein
VIDKNLIEDAKKALGAKAADIIATGLNIGKWNSSKLKGLCPFHNEKTPSFVWNEKSNSFKCFGCGQTYDIIDYYTQAEGFNFIEALEALFYEAGINYDFESEKARNRKREYRFPKEESNEDLSAIEKYLKVRCISKKTIDYAGVKQDSKGNIAFEYKDQYGQLLLVKYRPSRKIKKSENKTWCQKDADTTPILYGMELINPSKPLLICEGEIDRLAAIEAGFKNTASVPFGANNYHWIEYNWDWLEQFEKIIIWSDNDEAGEKMRKEVVPRLGEYRCYYVKSPYKDINIHLYKKGPVSVLKAIENAKEVPISHVIDMADVEDFDIHKAEKISSGLNGLDRWIHGYVLGTVDVITGINGSGKSTFVDQVCVCEPLEQGYKTFIFSGELTKPQLRSWIEYPMAGPDVIQVIDNGPNAPKSHRISKQIKNIMREWYKGKIFIYDNDLDYRATSILKKMEELARKHGVKNFVLDNLMMIDLECNEYEKYTKQKYFMIELIRFARKYNSVVHLVAHPRKTERIQRLTKLDVAGSGDITNLAHYVTAIHRVTPKEKEDIYKNGKLVQEGCLYDCIIDLFKNRPIGYQDKSVGVYFDIKSKRFYGDSDTPNKQYSWSKVDSIPDFIEVEVKAPWDD